MMTDGNEQGEQEEEPCAYLIEGTDRYEWTEKADKLWRAGNLAVTFDGSTSVPVVTVSGECPRCGHPFSSEQILRAIVSEREQRHLSSYYEVLTRPVPAPRRVRLTVSCRCSEYHAGRPATKPDGCGANFSLLAKAPG
jgi:hypothetical protein